MYRVGLLLCSLLLGLYSPECSEASWLTSPRYKLYGRAKLVRVEGPNILRLNMLGSGRTVTVRLLGVGSPHNPIRTKLLTPRAISYIEKEDVWERAGRFMESLLRHREVEVRTRRWDRYDEKNRLLAYLLIPSQSGEPLDVNAELIRRGFGFVTRDYVHVTFTWYKILEEEAREFGRGVWKGLYPGRVSSLNE